MYKFNLKNNEILDTIRSPYIYEFNLGRNLALLSDDVAVIRYFYQVSGWRLSKDQWIINQLQDTFLGHFELGNAFSYFGIIPMIAEGKTNLVASSGFKCKSKDPEIDEALNELCERQNIYELFGDGVYWESGIGDFAYRLSYDPSTSNKPLIDIVEPQNLEVNYIRGKVKSYVIKEVAEDDPNYELHEIHYLDNDGYNCITYRFWYDGKYVAINDTFLVAQCRQHFNDIDTQDVQLPIKGFVTIVYKQNANKKSKLYQGKRGVPDIQGLDTIEDALTEATSDYIDAIRKGGIKEWIDNDLIPQDRDGNTQRYNSFNKRIVYTKSSTDPTNVKNKLQVTQGQINWESYTQAIRLLISTALNKAGLSPTTIGLTGLESISSSAEAQEARERTSLRTRERALNSWRITLRELLNKYLQLCDYLQGRDIGEYSDLINIHFDTYVMPSVESITEVLAKQVGAGLKSPMHAIKDLNQDYDEEDAINELMDIQGMQESQEDLQLTPVEANASPPNANFLERDGKDLT